MGDLLLHQDLASGLWEVIRNNWKSPVDTLRMMWLFINLITGSHYLLLQSFENDVAIYPIKNYVAIYHYWVCD
jgi:hypothetical protein